MSQHHPICPHCGHTMSYEEMVDSGGRLFDITVAEETVETKCPSCQKSYWVKGGYIPTYETAATEGEL